MRRSILIPLIGFALIATTTLVVVARSAFVSAKSMPLIDRILYDQPTPPIPEPAAAIASGASSTLPQSAVVPIIVYHIVRPSYPSDDAAVRALAVTPETFAAQLAHLQSAGYQTISFDDLERYFRTGAPLPPKPVIISFDDGWGDQFQYAFPVLQQYKDTATFFVFTNSIGHKGFMTWDDLRELAASGMSIGDHTKSHPFLTKIVNPAKLWDEINGSKIILQEQLGIQVTTFAYPFGQYNDAIISTLRAAGFEGARGDYWNGDTQTPDKLYGMSAMNAPTSTEKFIKQYP
ncbi:MAG: polysaccharide deacetylase family protein [Candidatus Pacebacteria bacterium]|nr:polysaccharide deacetylase family protein [Candidatus Paceibacterota bacterium]